MNAQLTIAMIFGVSTLAATKFDRTELELPRSLPAFRLTTGELRIDGMLDETVWREAEVRSNFVQRNPLEGTAPTERTEFSVIYDDEYIYVGVEAYDSRPDSIVSILSRRDEMTPSDWIHVSFDSYSDYRTAFEFWLNPQGVKRDVRRFNDEGEDANWDAIWEGKTTTGPHGWTAEFRIPFTELRFSEKENRNWGLQVYRHISRKNEDEYWTYWSKGEGGWVRHYGRLTNLENIPQQRQIYVAPYTISRLGTSPLYSTDLNPDTYRLGQTWGPI